MECCRTLTLLAFHGIKLAFWPISIQILTMGESRVNRPIAAATVRLTPCLAIRFRVGASSRRCDAGWTLLSLDGLPYSSQKGKASDPPIISLGNEPQTSGAGPCFVGPHQTTRELSFMQS